MIAKDDLLMIVTRAKPVKYKGIEYAQGATFTCSKKDAKLLRVLKAAAEIGAAEELMEDSNEQQQEEVVSNEIETFTIVRNGEASDFGEIPPPTSLELAPPADDSPQDALPENVQETPLSRWAAGEEAADAEEAALEQPEPQLISDEQVQAPARRTIRRRTRSTRVAEQSEEQR